MSPLCREVSEWLKEHAWNACKVQAFEGSNPFLSAIIIFCYITLFLRILMPYKRLLIFCALFVSFFLAFLLIFTTIWIKKTFGAEVQIAQILFHIQYPITDTDPIFIKSFMLKSLMPSILLSAIWAYLCLCGLGASLDYGTLLSTLLRHYIRSLLNHLALAKNTHLRCAWWRA